MHLILVFGIMASASLVQSMCELGSVGWPDCPPGCVCVWNPQTPDRNMCSCDHRYRSAPVRLEGNIINPMNSGMNPNIGMNPNGPMNPNSGGGGSDYSGGLCNSDADCPPDRFCWKGIAVPEGWCMP